MRPATHVNISIVAFPNHKGRLVVAMGRTQAFKPPKATLDLLGPSSAKPRNKIVELHVRPTDLQNGLCGLAATGNDGCDDFFGDSFDY